MGEVTSREHVRVCTTVSPTTELRPVLSKMSPRKVKYLMALVPAVYLLSGYSCLIAERRRPERIRNHRHQPQQYPANYECVIAEWRGGSSILRNSHCAGWTRTSSRFDSQSLLGGYAISGTMISGVAGTAGTCSFAIRVTDSQGNYSIRLFPSLSSIQSRSLRSAH